MKVAGRMSGLVVRVALDLIALTAAYILAFYLRFDGHPPDTWSLVILQTAPLVVFGQGLLLVASGVYRSVWRYTGLSDLLAIVRAVTLGALGNTWVLGYYLYEIRGFPRAIIVIDFVLAMGLLAGLRVAGRVLGGTRNAGPRAVSRPKRVLLVGAGDMGETIIRQIQVNPRLHHRVICLADDDPTKRGLSIHGVKVRGTVDDIPSLVARCAVDDIVIAIPSASPGETARIVRRCQEAGVPYRMVPGLSELIDGRVSFSQLRKVDIEDLLGRQALPMDLRWSEYLRGQRVLVTGAGGSIGGELCRHLARSGVARLILLDRDENNLYEIDRHIRALNPGLAVSAHNADIVNREKLVRVCCDEQPNVVFHAAALKHVPLCEANVDEAVLVNIIGTRNVIDAAEAGGADRVICISTDKAVEPVSVMGQTKRMSELVAQQFNRRRQAPLVAAVRFGNVLGSRGSVIPLFREQIEHGGPVTVTDPAMSRFFMTISEAAQLILCAGAIMTGGDLFVLDMGERIKILDLAREMIRLSGYEPDTDIPIRIIGIRPGEKLSEEVVAPGERVRATAHPKVQQIEEPGQAPVLSPEELADLDALARDLARTALRARLRELTGPAATEPMRPPLHESPN